MTNQKIATLPSDDIEALLTHEGVSITVTANGTTVIDPEDARAVHCFRPRVWAADGNRFLRFVVELPLSNSATAPIPDTVDIFDTDDGEDGEDDPSNRRQSGVEAIETDVTPTTDTDDDGDDDASNGHTTAHSDDGDADVVEPSVSWSLSEGPPS